MIFKFRGRQYILALQKSIFPIRGIHEFVHNFKNEPNEYPLIINGNKLDNKVVLITGGYKGIGLHIAIRLIKDGAKVIITGRNENQLNKTIEKYDTNLLKGIVWDISDYNVSEHFAEAEACFGRIDILVNNAGVTSDTKERPSFEAMSKKHYHYVHDINTIGSVRMCEEFAKRSNNGTILNIISNTSVLPALDSYFTSKWALYSYTKEAGRKYADKGLCITVNGLCPGPIKTDMSFGPSTSLYRQAIPNHRLGLPEEIAELAFVQIVAGLRGLNGEITVCDGGQILR